MSSITNVPEGWELRNGKPYKMGEPSSAPPAIDESRCAVCGWPLAKSRDEGCMPGDCSMRPFPENAFDPHRANKEYAAYKLRPRWAESGAAQEVSPEHILRNLLAVIHRDGGHYAAEHGLEKAGEDAEALVLKERVEEVSPPSPEPQKEVSPAK